MFITHHGKWYHNSWKGDVQKSGGIATNIGIHLFDLAAWLFGELEQINVEENTAMQSIGKLNLQNANVQWNLSIEQNKKPQRMIIIDGKPYEFTDGFADLHTQSYREILNQKRFYNYCCKTFC